MLDFDLGAEIEADAQYAPDPAAEQIAKAKAAIEAAIERQPEDVGAVFEADVQVAWNEVFDGNQAEFIRLRERAKTAGASKAEIDKVVGARRKRAGAGKSSAKDKPHTFDPFATRAESTRDTFGIPSEPDLYLRPGDLLEEDDDGRKSRMIESLAAEVVAAALHKRLAWDAEGSTWHVWMGTHWEPKTIGAEADSVIANAVHVGTHPLGFRPSYLSGITQIAQRRGLFALPANIRGVIPFANGLLDTATGEISAATPERAADWCMPHAYDRAADCPSIKAWLLRCVEGDTESVELLRAWLAALVRNIQLQKFLMLLGRGRSGKGTFQRLTVAVVGARNTAISALRDLEENRFETAKLYGKRLCMINEAGRHGGALNMLKAITGGDHIPLERKHVQQAGSFVFEGLVLMATNEDLQSSDSTSGLERRRVTVRFPRSATPEEIADWDAIGGEEAVLHVEIPGLINWLLAMPEPDIRRAFEAPPTRVAVDNLLGMAAGNSVADWLIQCTTPDPDGHAQVGVKQERRNKDDGAVYFEHAADWAFASYLTHCLEHGRARPVSVRKFSDTVIDIAETLGHPCVKKQHPESRAACIYGMRLGSDPKENAWAPKVSAPKTEGTEGIPKGSEWIEPASGLDRRYRGQNFTPENRAQTHKPRAEEF